MTKPWSPEEYDAWYKTPLGSLSDRLEKELVFTLMDLKPGEAALDVGCGTGNYTIEVVKRGLKATGVDSSEDMLALAKEKARREKLDITFQRAGLAEPFEKLDRAVIPRMGAFLAVSAVKG